MGAGVVVSVAAENKEDNLLPLEIPKVDVYIVVNATTVQPAMCIAATK